jgi:ribonuclease VapC
VFIDASAAVALILKESDFDELRQKLKSSRRRTMSAISTYESVMAIRRVRKSSVAEAHALVDQFQSIFAVTSVDIQSRFTKVALEAFERFGKGQGHPAQLNMGDCFSYACAKLTNVPLLCKGSDFIKTDIRIA